MQDILKREITDISLEDISNIANYGLMIEDVELSIFLREELDNMTKISLRSKSSFDCSDFATLFNGGGHARAAGCLIDNSLDHAKDIILQKVKEIGI